MCVPRGGVPSVRKVVGNRGVPGPFACWWRRVCLSSVASAAVSPVNIYMREGMCARPCYTYGYVCKGVYLSIHVSNRLFDLYIYLCIRLFMRLFIHLYGCNAY